eukprot:Tbor_TRINITY_DN5294_c1_g1::TRINITY_DN5294_c1_g1_i1::g.16008::m.16008/K14847/RPF2; ribosome production factor 2
MSTTGGFKRRQGKTKSSQRALRKMDPKVFETPKKIIFLRGANTSDVVNAAMNDLAHITKPHCKKLKKRNAFHAFEGAKHLEFLGFKNDCSLFCFGSDNKKRPHNLVIGRHFDFHVLDMVELGIQAMDPLAIENVKGMSVASIGSKPFFVFEGSEFDTEAFFIRLKNFFLDYFKGSTDPEILLDGVDRAIMVSLRSMNGTDAVVAPSEDCLGTKPQSVKGNAVVCFRHYAVKKTASAVGVPSSTQHVELVDIGPNFDFDIRRVYFAPPAEFKSACKLPREAIAHLKSLHENVNTDSLGNLKGQLHIGKQDVTKLNLRRFSAYKKNRAGVPLGEDGVPVKGKGGEYNNDDDDDDGDHRNGEEGTRKRRRRAATSSVYESDFPEMDI